jgi:predicted PurR-regulated permease PerM
MAATPEQLVTDAHKLFLIVATLAFGWVFYLLAPVLMPFFMAALFAYLGDHIVDRLEERKLSRTLSVSIVFAVLLTVGLLLFLVLIPLLTAQVGALFKRLPEYLGLFQSTTIPWLASLGFPVEIFDVSSIKQNLIDYWASVGQVAGSVFGYMTSSGLAILQWLTNLVLVPVLTFYLLRDWDDIVARIRALLPRRYAKQVVALSLECDDMLAAFIRGQLMVMFALAIIYTIGLSLVGLELALLLGVIAGIVSFVPYLGLIVGIGLSGVAAFFQFHEWLPVIMVVGVFGFVQLIEGMVLTPRFVGERIGLHPVAVLFAVLAGAQLFGFIGVLLALPVAAIVMVLLRHTHKRYLDSELYLTDQEQG